MTYSFLVISGLCTNITEYKNESVIRLLDMGRSLTNAKVLPNNLAECTTRQSATLDYLAELRYHFWLCVSGILHSPLTIT